MLLTARQYILAIMYQYYNDPDFHSKVKNLDSAIVDILKSPELKKQFKKQHKRWRKKLMQAYRRILRTIREEERKK